MAKRRSTRRAASRSKTNGSRTTKKTAKGAKRRPARRARRASRAAAIRPMIDLGRVWATITPRLPAEFRVHVRRPDDLLVFDLLFVLTKSARTARSQRHSGFIAGLEISNRRSPKQEQEGQSPNRIYMQDN